MNKYTNIHPFSVIEKSNKKPLIFLSLILCFSFISNAQLIKQWDYRFGGTAIDEFHDIVSIFDTNTFDTRAYLLAGYSESGANGDKTNASQGSGDFWLINVNSLGVKQWDKSYGGSNYDELFEVQQTNDGGFILGGWSNSGISGDKSQPNVGAGDYWIVKTDLLGTKLWDKTFGGTSEDYLQSIKQTSDGGYILAGRSNSGISGSKTQANRGTVGVTFDYWVVKINASGTKLWDQTFGGFDDDWLFTAQQTSDGGYIFGGYSNSGVTGDKSQANVGLDDYWMVKTDANGVKQWDKTFGGTNADQLQALIQTSDGGYLLGGGSSSGANGDKTQGSRGSTDYWIVKTNASGTKQWDKRFGGTSIDNLFDLIQTTDGGYLLGGSSSSAASGDKSQGNQGTVGTSYDYWLVKIDASGIAQVERRFGGSLDDYAKSICEAPDGNYTVAGWSTSGLTGDKTQASRGSIDYWVVNVSGPNSITTGSISSPQCEGTSLNIPFTITGTYASGNTFTAQLSDANGSFASPTTIGTLAATSSGTITAVLPLLTPAGALYQVRVISNNPVTTDIYPSTTFTINATTQYFLDSDNDTYGDPSISTYSCTPLAGYVTDNQDCNDSDSLVHQIPGGADGIVALSLNCEGSSGNLFDADRIFESTSYQWFLTPGLSSTSPGNITPDTLISISIALGTSTGVIAVVGSNSCGISDTAFYYLTVPQLPLAPGTIIGDTLISSCTNQIGIVYSIAPIPNAINYAWILPDSATIIGNADTNSIVVNFSAYGVSGTLSVSGNNTCGSGPSSSIAITYEPIPNVEICFITVDSLSQKGMLWWQKPSAPQSDSLVILRKNKTTSLFEKIATVKDTTPTSYLDLGSDPTTLEGESYKMAVKDTCGNIGSFSSVATHKTIYLYGYLGWSGVPKLYWDDYIGITDPGRYYRVLKDTLGNGPFDVVVKDSIFIGAGKFATDYPGINCTTCRYVVEMKYESNCDTTARMMATKSTSRGNIVNRIAMVPDPTETSIWESSNLTNFVTVYPNPAHENFSIYFQTAINSCTIKITTILGENIWEQNFKDIKPNSKQNINTNSFSKGVYIISVSTQNSISLSKIVIN